MVEDTAIKRELEYINRLEINVAFPFLLQVFEDADNGILSKEDLLKINRIKDAMMTIGVAPR